MSFTQSSTKALVTQNVVAVKPPDLDSSLFRIRKAAVDIKALLLKFPENRKIDETTLLFADITFTLTKTLVVLCEDDLKQTSPRKLKPEFLALWHHSIADCKVAMAEYCAKTSDEKALQKLLKEATPHLIDVNAYLLDYPQIEYRLLSETVIVTPQQQKAVIARYKVVGKKK